MILGFLAEAGRAKRKKMAKRRVMDGLRSLRVKLFGEREIFRSISRIFNASLERLIFVALGNFELPSDDWLRVCFPVVCQEFVDHSEGFSMATAGDAELFPEGSEWCSGIEIWCPKP